MDYGKPMPVVKSQRDLYMTDDGQLMPKKREDEDSREKEDSMESCLGGFEEDGGEDVSLPAAASRARRPRVHVRCALTVAPGPALHTVLPVTRDVSYVRAQDLETIRILQEQYEKESKKANIPVPPIMTVDDYDRFVAKDFSRPAQYLKNKGSSAPRLLHHSFPLLVAFTGARCRGIRSYTYVFRPLWRGG